MKSNTVNPMQNGTSAEVLDFLIIAADMNLSTAQRDSAEKIISALGKGATLQRFVEAATTTPGLHEFGVKLGAYCLPGERYEKLYESEYGSLEA